MHRILIDLPVFAVLEWVRRACGLPLGYMCMIFGVFKSLLIGMGHLPTRIAGLLPALDMAPFLLLLLT